MKLPKFVKITAVALIAILAISILGLYIWSRTGTYPARPVALAAMQSSQTVTVADDEIISFSPTEPAHTGIIFYPGGLVEPAAYAPVLHAIAQEGILVVITPMPFNLAIFNTGAAEDVIGTYPDIDRWILAGHSLGGAAAAIYAYSHPESIDGLVFWDSYPPNSASLSDDILSVLSIYGTTNGVPNTENFDDTRDLLPEDALFVPIEGASHAQFGDYGPQKDDVEPSISLAEQHQQVTEIMLKFIIP